MPADLLDVPAIKAFLGITGNADDALLEQLSEGLEGLLERETGRVFAAGMSVTETQNGTGRRVLYSDRPVSSLTSVVIGQNPSIPDETLVVGPTVVVTDAKLPRRLVRVDGGVFPRGIANVRLVYDSADNLPADCRLALQEAIALVYRRRGSEDAAIEATGTFSHTLVQELRHLPTWSRVLSRTAAPVIL